MSPPLATQLARDYCPLNPAPVNPPSEGSSLHAAYSRLVKIAQEMSQSLQNRLSELGVSTDDLSDIVRDGVLLHPRIQTPGYTFDKVLELDHPDDYHVPKEPEDVLRAYQGQDVTVVLGREVHFLEDRSVLGYLVSIIPPRRTKPILIERFESLSNANKFYDLIKRLTAEEVYCVGCGFLGGMPALEGPKGVVLPAPYQ